MAASPAFMILADGIDVTAGINARLLSMTLTDNAGGQADTLSITVADRDGNVVLPGPGAKLNPFFGYAGTAMNYMGEFTVDETVSSGSSSGRVISITAKSVDTNKTQKQKSSRSWENKTLGEILKEECERDGLSLLISPYFENIKREHTARQNQSLLDFGTSLAKKYGAVFKIAGSKALFVEPQSGISLSGLKLPIVPVVYGVNLQGWNIRPLMGRMSYGQVQAHWHNRNKAERVTETVSGNEAGPIFTLARMYDNADEAKAAAKGKQEALARSKGGGSFTISGNPYAMAESKVLALGIKTGVDGLWYAKTVVHAFSGGGYVTTLTVEPPKKKQEK